MEIKKTKKITALLFALFLLLSLVSLNAWDFSEPSFTVGSGLVVDIAPFGVEQLYPTLSAGVGTSGSPGLWLRPSLAVNSDSRMFRLPLHLSLDVFKTGSDRFRLVVHGGGGVEVYRSDLHDTDSPLLEVGFSLFFGRFFMGAVASRVYRSYNVDSDLTVTGGVLFSF